MTTTSGPLITNDRARREWQYIVERVGEQAAREAIGRLPGRQRPYPLNVARVLGLKMPQELAQSLPDRQKALEHIAKLRRILKA